MTKSKARAHSPSSDRDSSPSRSPSRSPSPRPKSAKSGKSKKPGKSSSRKPRDPNAPKRPISAYIAFAASRRPALKHSHPLLSFADLSKSIASEWSSLSDSAKAPFLKIAHADKLRFQRAQSASHRSIPLAAAGSDDQ